jgi:hypothetical protein
MRAPLGLTSTEANWPYVRKRCGQLGPEAMITRNLSERILMVRCGSHVGTGFTFEVDERQYLFTAAHVVEALETPGHIEISDAGAVVSQIAIARWWKHPNPAIDVAVLVPPRQLTPAGRLEVAMEGIAWAQNAYFVGFPYGTRPEAHGVTGPRSPYARMAIVSAFEKREGATYLHYVLDGHAAVGFSGAPVALRLHSDPPFGPIRVAGILTSFRTMPHPVAAGDRELDMSVAVQSGYVIAENISYACDGARSLGCGVPVSILD